MFARYANIGCVLIGVTFVSVAIYWATHFRRELMVVRNLLDYGFTMLLG